MCVCLSGFYTLRKLCVFLFLFIICGHNFLSHNNKLQLDIKVSVKSQLWLTFKTQRESNNCAKLMNVVVVLFYGTREHFWKLRKHLF